MSEAPRQLDQSTFGNEQRIRELLSRGLLDVKKIFQAMPYPPFSEARLSSAFSEPDGFESQYFSNYQKNVEFLRQLIEQAKSADKDTVRLEEAMSTYQHDAAALRPYVERYLELDSSSEPLTDQEHRRIWNGVFAEREKTSGYDAPVAKKVWERRGLDASFTTWGDFWLKTLFPEDSSMFDVLENRMKGKPVIDLGGGAERILPLCVLVGASAYVNVDTNILPMLCQDIKPPPYGFYDARPLLPGLSKRMRESDSLSRYQRESGERSLKRVEWKSRVGDTAIMLIPDLIQHVLPLIKDRSANLIINGWGTGGVDFNDTDLVNVADHVKRIVPPGGIVLTTGSERVEIFLGDDAFTRMESPVDSALHVLVRNGQ